MPLECNTPNMTRLVEALESGDYEQGTYQLRKADDTYCCLGVACEISGVGQWMRPAEGASWQYVTQRGYCSAALPDAVVEWLGLPRSEWDEQRWLPLNSIRDIPEFADVECGASANDRGASFAQIAAAIRKDYLSEEEH